MSSKALWSSPRLPIGPRIGFLECSGKNWISDLMSTIGRSANKGREGDRLLAAKFH